MHTAAIHTITKIYPTKSNLTQCSKDQARVLAVSMETTHNHTVASPSQQRKLARLDAELSATPVATLGVVLDLTISLQPEPLGKRLVGLVLHTNGALRQKALVTRHLERLKALPTETG